MGRVLPIVIAAMLTIYCVVEVAQSDPYAVRRMPRWLWATIVIVFPVVGPICWLIFGRPTRDSRQQSADAGPRTPDDDTDFLRGL